MNFNSVWKTSNNSASAVWKGEDQDSPVAELTVATDSPLSGGTLTIGEDQVSLLALEKIQQEDDPVDMYVRGDDLVAKYSSSGHPFEREVYWRYFGSQENEIDQPGPALAAVELIYSLQTDVLDSNPSPKVTSQLEIKSHQIYAVQGDRTDDQRSWKLTDSLADGQLVVATLAHGAKIAIGVYPSDLAKLEMSNDVSPKRVIFYLNSHFLEKGVIRRTRMFVCCGGADVDESDLLQQATVFLNSKIPLTT